MQNKCLCGCGTVIPEKDTRNRPLRFVSGHQNRIKSQAQIDACTATINRVRLPKPWNKGLSYVMSKRKHYATSGSLNAAMNRYYKHECMNCGWDKTRCDTHHIHPKRHGGVHSFENAVLLCPNCHRLAEYGILTAKDIISIKQNAVPVGRVV